MYRKSLFFAIIFTLINAAAFLSADIVHGWERLDEGLFLGKFNPTVRSNTTYKYKVLVLKIDPERYSFKLLSSSEQGGKILTPDKWCRKYNLVAAINASMYKEDGKASTGYMRNADHINNPYINPKFGAFMVFNPVDASVPEVQIIDRHHQEDWKGLIKRYSTVVQNYRMISLAGNNVWEQSEKKYSTAAVGMDREDNVLFIYCRSPYTTHDFNNILLTLPINIKNAMYVEGGPEASLYINAEKVEMEINLKVGNQKAGSSEENDNQSVWPIPNVIGVVKKVK